jgi:alkyl hydroperoxide reductase subunit D
MKNLNELKQSLTDYAKDIKINLSNILAEDQNSELSQHQVLGVALASALATKEKQVIWAIENEARKTLSETEINGIKAATSIMAMNNIYYRFTHLTENKEYAKKPANLRMQIIASHGVDKNDFEMYCLAVSIINGCGMCIDSHEKKLIKVGISENSVQTIARIAAVINAFSFVISTN